MNKLLTKIVGVVIGTSMAVGVGTAVVAKNSQGINSEVHATGSPATLQITSGVTSNGTLIDDNGKSWTLSAVTTKWTSNSSYIHIGTNSAEATSISLSTSDYSDVSITKVQVWAAAKASTNVTTKISIDDNLLGTSSVLGNTASSGGTEFSVNNSNNYSGDIDVLISRPSSATGAIYFNKLIVTFSGGVDPTISSVAITGAPNDTVSGVLAGTFGPTLTATASFATGSGTPTWTWASDNTSAVKVTSGGRLAYVGTGTAHITATASIPASQGGTNVGSVTVTTSNVTVSGALNPLTVDQAISLMDTAGTGVAVLAEVYVTGTFKSGTTYDGTYSQWQGEFPGTSHDLVVKATNDSGVDIGTDPGDADGKECVVKGYLQLYNGNYQLSYLPAGASPTGSAYTPSIVSITVVLITAEEVEDLIDAIGTVTYTSACKEKIDAARDLADDYDKQENCAYADITNYSTLTAAEATYTSLMNQALADAVEDLIDAIGTIEYTSACKALIDAARDAYDDLTETQKALVENYETLTDAEAAYAALAPLSVDYTFVNGDQSRSVPLVGEDDDVIGYVTAYKGTASTAPAWNSTAGEVRVYHNGFLRVTVNEGYLLESITLSFVKNKASGASNVAPEACYYVGEPGTEYASESFSTSNTLTSGDEFDLNGIGVDEEFALKMISSTSNGNVGFTSIQVTYSKEVVVTPELRTSVNSLTVALNDTNTFTVFYYNIESDFAVVSGDNTKVTVSYTGAHGAEGSAVVTVNGLALTGNTPVDLTISATGATSKTVSITVKQIEQFKKVTTIDKLVENCEFVFSDDASISSSFDSSKNRYTMVSVTPVNNIISTEETYVKFRFNLDATGYTIFDLTNEKYLASNEAKTGEVAMLNEGTSDAAHWTISLSSGKFVIRNVAQTGIYLQKNSGYAYFACYNGGQSNMSIYVKGADSITSSQSLDAFGRLYLNTVTNPITTTPTGVDTGVCRTSGAYLRAKAALAGDWSVIRATLQSDTTGYALRYESWAIANNDAAPYDGNTTVVTEINNSKLMLGNVFNDNNAILTFVIVVSVLSITTLGGYFLLRKRKEER